MRTKMYSAIAAAVAGVATAGVANAAVVFSTGFEAPTYAPGALTSQDGWTTGQATSSGTTPTNSFQVINNAAAAYQGSQYANVNSTLFPSDSGATSYKVSSAWQPNFDASPVVAANGKVHIQVAMFQNIATTSTKTVFQTVDVYGNAGTTSLLSFGLYNSGSTALTSRVFIQAFQGNTGGFVINNGTTTAGGTNSWVNKWWLFDITLDYGTNQMTALVIDPSNNSFYDIGALLTAPPTNYNMSISSSNVFSDADLTVERDAHAGVSSTGGPTDNRFDGYLVETAIPEPSSAMLIMGGAGLMASRRRRRSV